MNFLDTLTPDQRETIISLPYRVGLWVSDSDSSGGDEANTNEIQALSNILHGFNEDMFGSETMQYIMSETLAKRDHWPQWSKDVASVPQDCRLAIDILKEKASVKDVNAFRNHLMEIGEAVAMAFHEEGARSTFSAYISYMFGKFRKNRASSIGSFQDYLRISVNEHKALHALAGALGTA
jgi:hypothetical protein